MSVLKWLGIAAGVVGTGYALHAASKPTNLVPVPKKTTSLSETFGSSWTGAAIFSAGDTKFVAKLKLDSSSLMPTVVPGTPADEKLPGFVAWGGTWLPQQIASGHRIFVPIGANGSVASTKTPITGSVTQYAIPLFVDTAPDNVGDVVEITQ